MDQDKSEKVPAEKTALERVFVDGPTPSPKRPPGDTRWSKVVNGAYVPNVETPTDD